MQTMSFMSSPSAGGPYSNEVLDDSLNDEKYTNMIKNGASPIASNGHAAAGDDEASFGEWESMFAEEQSSTKASEAVTEDKSTTTKASEVTVEDVDDDDEPPPQAAQECDPYAASPVIDDDDLDVDDKVPAKHAHKPSPPSPVFAAPPPPRTPQDTADASVSADDTPSKEQRHRKRRKRHRKAGVLRSEEASDAATPDVSSMSETPAKKKKKKRRKQPPVKASLVDDEAERSGEGGTSSSDDERDLSENSEFESLSGAAEDDEDEDDERPSMSAYRALDAERSAEEDDEEHTGVALDHFFGKGFADKVSFQLAQILKTQMGSGGAPEAQSVARSMVGASFGNVQPLACGKTSASLIAVVLAQSSQADVDVICNLVDKTLKRPWEEHARNLFGGYSNSIYHALQQRSARHMSLNPTSPFVACAMVTQTEALAHAHIGARIGSRLPVFLRFAPMFAVPCSALFRRLVDNGVLGPSKADCSRVVDQCYTALLPARVRAKKSHSFLCLPDCDTVAPPPAAAKRKREEKPVPVTTSTPREPVRHPLTMSVDPVTHQRTATDRTAFVYSIANQLRHTQSRLVLVPNEAFVALLKQTPRYYQQRWFLKQVNSYVFTEDKDLIGRKLPLRWLVATLLPDEKSADFEEARRFVRESSDDKLDQHMQAFLHGCEENPLVSFYAIVHVLAGFLRCDPARLGCQTHAPRITKRKHVLLSAGGADDNANGAALADTVLGVNELVVERSFVMTRDAERVYRLIFEYYLKHIGYTETYTADEEPQPAAGARMNSSTAKFLKLREQFAKRFASQWDQKVDVLDMEGADASRELDFVQKGIYCWVMPLFDAIFPTSRI